MGPPIVRQPTVGHKLATYFGLFCLALLVFATFASAGRGDDCRGNSPKKPCAEIEPAENATIRGTVAVRATLPDGALVAGVQFAIEGEELGLEDTTPPYEAAWDTTKSSNGERALTATVRGPEGQLTTSRNVVNVDNPEPDTTAPSVQVTAPTAGATVSGSVNVTVDASDNVGVVGVQFKLDGANLGAEDTSSPYSVSWDTTTSTNASHTLTAVARDAAGNTTTSSAIGVTVKNTVATPDSTPPSAQVTAPTAGATVNGTVTVAANASDNVGVAGVQFKLDGANLGAVDTSSPYSVSWDTTTSTNASHTLTAVARDAAGNTTTSSAIGVTVKNGTAGDPTTPSANLWVDTNGGSCARQAAPAGYADAQACGSFAAAYTAAQSGDVVGVAAGSYPDQFFAGGYRSSQGGGTKTLTFRGLPGNVIRALHFGSPNLTFDGLNVDAGGQQTTGAAFENGGAPFTFRNGRIGNVVDEKGALVTEAGIVFENVVFHDVVLRTPGVHNECIFAAVPDGMIIRNSTFTNCAVMDIFFVYPDWWSPLPPPYDNVTLENNTFGQPDGTYSLYIGKIGTSIASSAAVTGWTIRNNRFEGPINSDAPYGSGNTFCGNTQTRSGAVPSGWLSAC